jgi:hypothetical protein
VTSGGFSGGEPHLSRLPLTVVIPTHDRPESPRRAVESVLAGRDVPAPVVLAAQRQPPVRDIPQLNGPQTKA